MSEKQKYLDLNGLGYTIRKINERKADIKSPDFTGTPTAPNAAENTATTQIATTKFVSDYFVKKKQNILDNEIDDMLDEIIDGGGEIVDGVTFADLLARVVALETARQKKTIGFEINGQILKFIEE